MFNRNFLRLLTLTILTTAIFSFSTNTQAAELLTNGGCETNLVGWFPSTTNVTNSTLVGVHGFGAGYVYNSSNQNQGFDAPYSHAIFPQEGSRSCIMPLYSDTTGAGNSIIKFYQDITVPAGVTLAVSWKHRISQINAGNSTILPIRLSVYIKNTSDVILQTLHQEFLPINTNEVRPWQTKSVNLGTTYAGQTIRLEFYANPRDSNAPNYNITKAMWEIDAISANTFIPTASQVSLSGMVKTAQGRAISQTKMIFADTEGNIRTAMTNKFGYYEFNDIDAGSTYIIVAVKKGKIFSDVPRVLTIQEDMANEDFIAISETK